MVTQLGEKTRTARKQHRCSMCTTVIEPGEAYRVSTNIYDDSVYDWKDCAACLADKIVSEVFDWAGMPDEGVTYETAWDWAHEARHAGPGHPEIVRMAEAYLRRCGCNCEECESLRTTPVQSSTDG